MAIEELHKKILDKNTPPETINRLMQALLNRACIGLVQEAICSEIIEPSALPAVHGNAKEIPVVPLSGPSTFSMPLMASRVLGQFIVFHGSLPIDKKEKTISILKLETESAKEHLAQILIETPIQNSQL